MLDPDFRCLPQRPDFEPVLRHFESLGTTCELGLIQRHCLLDRPGLLRFGYTPFEGLVQALEVGFDGVGDPADLRFEEGNAREWISVHRRFGFEFHTQHSAETHSETAIRAVVKEHFGFLARKLMEDLEDAEKIFVYRPGRPGPAGEEGRTLLGAMRRYGPAILLWVDVAERAEPIGTAEWTMPGQIITGYLDRYAEDRFAAGASFAVWLQLVESARRLVSREKAATRSLPWLMHDPLAKDAGTVSWNWYGGILPLKLPGGHRIDALPPGWRGLAAYTGLEPLILLELDHQQWGRTTWFLTLDGYKIGDRLADLSPSYREQLKLSAETLFWQQGGCRMAARSAGFSQLNAATQNDILSLLPAQQ